MNIPFFERYVAKNEREYIKIALETQLSGDGPFTELCQKWFLEKMGIDNILMTTSCTHALELAMMILELGKNDEVIMPSYTFPSTANAAIMQGAKVVFCDIEKDTCNIDLEDLERKITKKTKVVVVVHYGGVCCDFSKLEKLSKKYGFYIVEDAAHGLMSKYMDEYLGTIGDFGCFSFHETKNISCGEGGALVINSRNKNILEKAKIIRQKGTNRDAFIKGLVANYEWMSVGSSYCPSDLLMALLLAQLEKVKTVIEKRKRIFNRYLLFFSEMPKGIIASFSSVPEYCSSNFHIFYIRLASNDLLKSFNSEMNKYNIDVRIHFYPLHKSKMGMILNNDNFILPNTEEVFNTLVRLPIYTEMTDSMVDYVLEKIEQWIISRKGRSK